jgi:hypothetical protein
VSLDLDIHQHLWDRGGAYKDVSEGQTREEEVHGGVEMGVRADSQDDEKVPHDGDHVHGQKQAEDEWLHFWIICQSQKSEFRNTCLICGFHVPAEYYRKDGMKNEVKS